ncbi:MAG: IS4 family transposase [Elusimicrobiota bacterium]
MARGRPKQKPVRQEDLDGFHYFRAIGPLLEALRGHKDVPNRTLHYDQYVSLLLFYFFNPVLTSLRGIQQASLLPKVQKKLGIAKTSLGSLSEAARVFDPEPLAEIIQELADKAPNVVKVDELDKLGKALTAVDGSILQALPKMAWALWCDEQHRAAKLHLQFEVLKGVPARADLTAGQASERAVLRNSLEAGRLYVIDRGYVEYGLFQAILDVGSSFVARVGANAVTEVVEERTLTEADRAAGVLSDRLVRVGCEANRGKLQDPVRIVEVRLPADPTRPGSQGPASKDVTLRLVTDQLDLPAEIIALCYRLRWTVELFFRWFKCILGCQHLLSTTKRGVTIQVYAALIASLLVSLWTGRKPTKRTFELLCFYFQGWASEEDLVAHLGSLKFWEDTAQNA